MSLARRQLLIAALLTVPCGTRAGHAAPANGPLPSAAPCLLPTTPTNDVVLRGAGYQTPETALRVFVGEASAPVQGRYAAKADGLHFTPFFPFMAGQKYRVETARPDAPPAVSFFQVVGTAKALPSVTGIAPTASVLPATTLRFYITFSGSMRGQFDRRELHLTDDAGRDGTGAFMAFGQELWSADGRRLTLLLDPGRIKRGVTANAAQGPPLSAGRTYTLTVALPASKTTATFRVSAPLRQPLDPAAWTLTPPKKATRHPLVLRFDRVMDRALLEDAITVRAADGTRIAGTAWAARGEREWVFTPDALWGGQAYRVVFSPALEDVSGNRIGEALDHEVSRALPQPPNLTLLFRAHQ